MVMQEGHVLRRSSPTAPAELVRFDTYAVDLERFEKKSEVVELRPRERYFTELAWPAADDPDFKNQPGHFRAELHERFANPLYPIAFVMIALAYVGQAQSTRQNRLEPILSGFAVATLIRLLGFAANNLAVMSGKFVPILYAIPLLAIMFSILAIQRHARPRIGPSLQGRISLAIEDLWQWATARWRGNPAAAHGGTS